MAPQRSRRWLGLSALALAATALTSCAETAPQSRLGWGPSELEAEHRCQQGAFGACGTLGRFLVGPTRSQKDIERGLVLLEVACGQDDVPACSTLGAMYTDRTHATALARARQILARTCDKGAGQACASLGEALQAGGAARGDTLSAYEKACTLGDARGCELLGQMRWRDEFGDGKKLAEDAFARACALGRRPGCHLLAVLQLRDPARRADGVALMYKTCESGHVESCGDLAAAFAPLVGGGDCERARQPARKACDGKNDESCAILDACELAGPTRVAALEGLQAACERNVGLACLYWADAQPAGANAERVESAYALACDEGRAVQVACPRVWGMALARAKLSIDAERPLADLRAACERDSGEACCRLAAEYESGKWMKADATKASELRAKACDLGQGPCCHRPPAPR